MFLLCVVSLRGKRTWKQKNHEECGGRGLRNGNECAPCMYGRVTKKPTALDSYYMLTLKSKLGVLCNGKKYFTEIEEEKLKPSISKHSLHSPSFVYLLFNYSKIVI